MLFVSSFALIFVTEQEAVLKSVWGFETQYTAVEGSSYVELTFDAQQVMRRIMLKRGNTHAVTFVVPERNLSRTRTRCNDHSPPTCNTIVSLSKVRDWSVYGRNVRQGSRLWSIEKYENQSGKDGWRLGQVDSNFHRLHLFVHSHQGKVGRDTAILGLINSCRTVVRRWQWYGVSEISRDAKVGLLSLTSEGCPCPSAKTCTSLKWTSVNSSAWVREKLL